MDVAINMLATPLGILMKSLYEIFQNYGLAIIMFTLLSKLILFPVSFWVQKNSIKMVRMLPELNNIKSSCFGDGDRIADEQSKIFKREKYNPLASIIPLFVQILLLMGIIEVIYHPFNYLLHMDSSVIQQLASTTSQVTGVNPQEATVQLAVVSAVQSGVCTNSFAVIPTEILTAIKELNFNFFKFHVSETPSHTLGINLLAPLLAGFSAWLLCFVQNRSNVLQSEQSNLNKYGLMIFSIALSLYLGYFVPIGVAIYWIASNLFAIVQLYLLNYLINPRGYIDYEALEESKEKLKVLQNMAPKNKWYKKDPNAKREKADYKRFFSIVNKHLVFYSAKSGFYKYFEDVIEELIRVSNVTIHYVTSDPNDAIFELAKEKPQIKPYYIGEKKLITLMMKMDADIVVMTMPDLENFHIKRSYIRKDIEYVYMYHGITNSHMVAQKGCFDHYDTIFCVGPHQIYEIRETESMYSLPPKNLIECGYPLIEKEATIYENKKNKFNEEKTITIAPSWQKDNILDSCIDELIPSILSQEYKIFIRPHPEYCKRYPQRLERLKERLSNYVGKSLEFQLDFSTSILETDLLITDWSTIAYEFAFITTKPVLFIDTPMKVLNPEYINYQFQPVDITWRKEVGKSLLITNLANAKNEIAHMLISNREYSVRLRKMRAEVLYNFGYSSQIAAHYLLQSLQQKGNR